MYLTRNNNQLHSFKDEYENLFKKLHEIRIITSAKPRDYNTKLMTVDELREKKYELEDALYFKYNQSLYKEYLIISKALNEVPESSFNFFEDQFNRDEAILYVRLMYETLEHKAHVYEPFDEAYEYLKLHILKKLIPLLNNEAISNQDAVNEVIDYIDSSS